MRDLTGASPATAPALARYSSGRTLFGGVLALFFSVVAQGLHADTLAGRCVAVFDGDTIVVRDTHRKRHEVRLQGIDAPEKGQRYGSISKSNLSALVYQKQVAVDWDKRDRYGRLVGRVTSNGIDASRSQLEAGLAWVYREYLDELSLSDRKLFLQAESTAQHKRLGLWHDHDPTPPWLWRHRAMP